MGEKSVKRREGGEKKVVHDSRWWKKTRFEREARSRERDPVSMNGERNAREGQIIKGKWVGNAESQGLGGRDATPTRLNTGQQCAR